MPLHPDASWIKASASDQGANCLETRWVTSSDSGHAQCVAVRHDPGGPGVHVRDSKHPDGPVLVFTEQEWAAFLVGAKRGEFDLP
jgi:hypothetical protein